MRTHLFGAAFLGMALATCGAAADGESCRTPRLSDVGWTDIAITTQLTADILRGLGYEPKVELLGLDITYASMRSRDIDIFLGSWVPGLSQFSDPYYADGSVEQVAANLTGAKFTWAVPRYVYDAGVKSFADLDAHKTKFGGKVYGVEPGGNTHIENVIAADAFGLGDWELVESSEAGMLTQVAKAVAKGEWIVFLGWAPHPMNETYEIEYLAGGDEFYGVDLGASVVYTDVRRGYLDECPNVAALLRNLSFTLAMENVMMGYVLNDNADLGSAVSRWVKSNGDWLAPVLEGVRTFEGEPGLPAVRRYFELS